MPTIYAAKPDLPFIRKVAAHLPKRLLIRVAPSRNAADELRLAVTDIAYQQEKPGRHVGKGTLVITRGGMTKTNKLAAITSHGDKALAPKDRAEHLASAAAAWAASFIETMVAEKSAKGSGAKRKVILSSFWCGKPFAKLYGKLLAERGYIVEHSDRMEYNDAYRKRSWARLEPGRVHVQGAKGAATIYIGGAEFNTKGSVSQVASKTMRVAIAADTPDAQAHTKLAAKHIAWFDMVSGRL